MTRLLAAPEAELVFAALLLTLLAGLVLALLAARSVLTCILLMSVFSLTMALWLMVMDAPDVAFTEASVGAGVSTMILLGAALSSTDVIPSVRPGRFWFPAVACLAAFIGMALALSDLPVFGDPGSPPSSYVGRLYLEHTPHDIGAPNVVTAVLASYRGFDTLGETSVILAAGVGVLLLLGGSLNSRDPVSEDVSLRISAGSPVLSVAARLLIPIICLYAFYVLAHGEFGAGGGFQAGVILAAALILHALVFGVRETMRALPVGVVRSCAALGVLGYASIGFIAILHGGRFLDYDALLSPVFEAGLPSSHLAGGHHHWGQRLGILGIETGVMLAVASTMTAIFYAFAGRVSRSDEAGAA
ncbi:MAG: DUF4040 domain-containing protein [Alphaproteobacteria bacterium]|nr:DUF4040 domain-containing protein [Alphaproteobacteria bacterium]